MAGEKPTKFAQGAFWRWKFLAERVARLKERGEAAAREYQGAFTALSAYKAHLTKVYEIAPGDQPDWETGEIRRAPTEEPGGDS